MPSLDAGAGAAPVGGSAFSRAASRWPPPRVRPSAASPAMASTTSARLAGLDPPQRHPLLRAGRRDAGQRFAGHGIGPPPPPDRLRRLATSSFPALVSVPVLCTVAEAARRVDQSRERRIRSLPPADIDDPPAAHRAQRRPRQVDAARHGREGLLEHGGLALGRVQHMQGVGPSCSRCIRTRACSHLERLLGRRRAAGPAATAVGVAFRPARAAAEQARPARLRRRRPPQSSDSATATSGSAATAAWRVGARRAARRGRGRELGGSVPIRQPPSRGARRPACPRRPAFEHMPDAQARSAPASRRSSESAASRSAARAGRGRRARKITSRKVSARRDALGPAPRNSASRRKPRAPPRSSTRAASSTSKRRESTAALPRMRGRGGVGRRRLGVGEQRDEAHQAAAQPRERVHHVDDQRRAFGIVAAPHGHDPRRQFAMPDLIVRPLC